MNTSGTFMIYRAKPRDAEAIADFVAAATRGRVEIPAESVLDRFTVKGLLVARDADGQIVGLAGWRAENLVARIDDFLIFPFDLYPSAGKALVERIEKTAQELQCEVCMLFVPLGASPTLVHFYESCGYKRTEAEGLPRVWNETIQEASEQGRYIMLRQLREDLVLRPI
jgi:N-acetylglutamate synthase-like GNAT family acetyltransferase